ncbi:MAG: hypothetical protein ACC645_04565 [Pirellulales bacterium]
MGFTAAELARMQRTLQRQLRDIDAANLAAIGFGMALKGGRPDPKRGLAACLFVRHKHAPRQASQRLPPRVEIRLRRGSTFQRLQLATDVVEVGRVVPTGWRLSAPDIDPVTGGAVVAWRAITEEDGTVRCGILTVGHAFATGRRPLVRIDPWPGETSFNGRLYLKSRRPSSADAAVIRVHPESLVENGLIDPSLVSGGRLDIDAIVQPEIVSPDQLASLHGAHGESLRSDTRVPFLLQAILPLMTIRGLGRLRNIISVWSPGADAFSPGTSGSLWEVEGDPAALQVAATPATYQLGFGQALVTGFDWARDALERDGQFVPGSFRFVAGV